MSEGLPADLQTTCRHDIDPARSHLYATTPMAAIEPSSDASPARSSITTPMLRSADGPSAALTEPDADRMGETTIRGGS